MRASGTAAGGTEEDAVLRVATPDCEIILAVYDFLYESVVSDMKKRGSHVIGPVVRVVFLNGSAGARRRLLSPIFFNRVMRDFSVSHQPVTDTIAPVGVSFKA
jgi:hypothetical protein